MHVSRARSKRATEYRRRAATALRAAEAAREKQAQEMFRNAAHHYTDLAALQERWIEPERPRALQRSD